MNLSNPKTLILVIFFGLASMSFSQTTRSTAISEQDIRSLEKTILKVLEAFNSENEKKINKLIHPEFQLAFIFRRGAADNLLFSEYLDFENPIPEYLPYKWSFTKYEPEIKLETLPNFCCENEWDKPPGIYCDTTYIDNTRSAVAKLQKEWGLYNWSENTIEKIEQIEQQSQQIIVLGFDGGVFIFYLTLDKNKWYLTSIDRFERCDA